ncbi:hypothetical protein ST201phi2-1p465 [Pseudomonas phage 201phi2-1]|uniref:Uncharacterized protein n=1 Tax=Pseudomonas phage 201phi2-1 TaxID=198110 RepID=B3FJX3_BP201|nr:hypothetical protein ST201phi2-1p465 [Pseudomonas phage 201phi2-1]ABY63288.1 hypothetical protein 201phi2-1p465 [Pseudomonas phage 201phi2-1]
MTQATPITLAQFGELNVRMAALVGAKTQAIFGTPEERTHMTNLTLAGIDSCNEMIELIKAGLTYESWKTYLDGKNTLDGILGSFENEDGDMAKLCQDYRDADLSEVYKDAMASGQFTVEALEANKQALEQRLEWVKSLWKDEDETAVAEANLADVAKAIDLDAQ